MWGGGAFRAEILPCWIEGERHSLLSPTTHYTVNVKVMQATRVTPPTPETINNEAARPEEQPPSQTARQLPAATAFTAPLQDHPQPTTKKPQTPAKEPQSEQPPQEEGSCPQSDQGQPQPTTASEREQEGREASGTGARERGRRQTEERQRQRTHRGQAGDRGKTEEGGRAGRGERAGCERGVARRPPGSNLIKRRAPARYHTPLTTRRERRFRPENLRGTKGR